MDPELHAEQIELEDATNRTRADGSGMTASTCGSNVEYVDATPRRPRRSAAEREAEAKLSHHWVAVIAYDRAIPRTFADNRGVFPVHVETAADWRTTGVKFDRQQPVHRAVRLAVVGVPTKAHADRLKDALEEAINGRANADGREPLRWRFRDMSQAGPVSRWWAPLMAEVLMRCGLEASEFDVFNRADHDRAVERLAAELMRRRGRVA